MAIQSRLYPETHSTQPGTVIVAGSVEIGSSGAVGTQHGKGFTVTRTGTGLYKVTLNSYGGVPDILYANAAVVSPTAGATQEAKLLTLTPSTADTTAFTLQINAAATPDVAAELASGSRLQIFVVVQNLAAAS